MGLFHELGYGQIMFQCLLICTYDFCFLSIALLCLLHTYSWLVGITQLGMSFAKSQTQKLGFTCNLAWSKLFPRFKALKKQDDILSNQGCLVIMLSSEMDNSKNFSIKHFLPFLQSFRVWLSCCAVDMLSIIQIFKRTVKMRC